MLALVPRTAPNNSVERWAPNAADFMADRMDLFEQRGMNHALWVWDPDWEPWTASENSMNYLFGPDPDNTTGVDNDLLRVITEAWARNTVRPSSLLADSPAEAMPGTLRVGRHPDTARGRRAGPAA